MSRHESIVQISSYYPPHLGGLEKVAQEISQQLARDGYKVTVLTSDIHSKDLDKVEFSGNLTVKRLWTFEFAHVPFIPTLFWELFKVKKPTIFHVHLAQAFVPEIVWIVAKLRSIPYIVHYHLDVEPSGPFGFIFVWYKRWILPTIIKDADKIITLSEDQSKLINDRHKVPFNRIVTISNGVSNQFLEIGKQARVFHKPLRLLFVGRLAMQKRPERLIQAIKLINNEVILNIVGDGEDAKKLKDLVSELNLKNVIFSGKLIGDGLALAYKNADVFVLPSDREGMSLAALEAMGSGLPIVGSDVLGIHELISGVGILVKNPSPETFAKAIDELIENEPKLYEMSRASYNKAVSYSWGNLINKLEQVYKELMV